MKKSLLFVSLIVLGLTSCEKRIDKEELFEEIIENTRSETVAWGVVERKTDVIWEGCGRTIAYLQDETILTQHHKRRLSYPEKQFTMVQKGDTVFYDISGHVTRVKYAK